MHKSPGFFFGRDGLILGAFFCLFAAKVGYLVHLVAFFGFFDRAHVEALLKHLFNLALNGQIVLRKHVLDFVIGVHLLFAARYGLPVLLVAEVAIYQQKSPLHLLAHLAEGLDAFRCLLLRETLGHSAVVTADELGQPL